MNIESCIRTIADYPKPGVDFRDITPLLASPEAFRFTIEALARRHSSRRIDKVVGIEARGFIIGAALALQLGAGFVPIRKVGRLPFDTIGEDYQLEYGTGRIEMHVDALQPEESVLVVDDLIATGGTAEAACSLVQRCGGRVVECCCIVDLSDLGGRLRLEQRGFRVHSVLRLPIG